MSYKMKTKSSIKKRFKITGSGKIKRAKAGKRHLLTHKTRSRKNNLTNSGLVSTTHHRLIVECMPYA